MNVTKTMCDRLGYKYKDLFEHLEFIFNKMNIVLNNYGNGLSDEELKMLNELFLKLETGQIEIIEFKNQICQFDADKKIKEEKEKLELEKDKEINRLNNIIDELSKWLEEDLKQQYRDCGHRNNIIREVYNKLNELKGDNK